MKSQIKEMVVAVEEAAANRDVEQLKEFLHKDYRVVANRFKGSEDAVIISKESYLQMMEDEKIGGTHYEINFNDVKVTAHTAIVDVVYASEKTSDMHKYLILIQDENHQWKIVSDIPIVME